MNRSFLRALQLGSCLLLLIGCNPERSPVIEDAASGQVLAEFSEVRRTGRRDGDRLPANIRMSASGSRLDLSLLFRIGVPTSLLEGSYVWANGGQTRSGKVQSRSLTFLGGQSDHPNLGGIFELLDENGRVQYKVTVPTGEVLPR